jgi:transposase
MSTIRFVGLDVHADTISIAVADANGDVRRYGKIPNSLDAVRRAMKKLAADGHELRTCYEAGPTGYVLFWQLTALGLACEVIAPSLIPTKAGDRVKNDPRDAERLARAYRAGDLTPVWVPDQDHEALRDLVRAREDAKQDQTRARHRLSKFLLRHGLRPDVKTKAWTQKYMEWVKRRAHFEQAALEATLRDYVHEVEHAAERILRLEKDLAEAIAVSAPAIRAVVEALQALRGIAFLTAVTIVAELGMLSRFANPRQLMGYSGLVASEYSSGSRIQRGGITKTGNAHLRRVVVEAAWAYQHRPWVGGYLGKRQKGLDPEIIAARGKNKPQIVTAVGRELLGFIWAIAMKVEAKFRPQLSRAA